MYTRLPKLFCLWLLVFTFQTQAQKPAAINARNAHKNDLHATGEYSKQLDYLADAGKLWGYVNYFHPYLRYKKINWDSAFAANVPSILAAQTKAAYEEALQKLLQVLDDPLTRVLKKETKHGPVHPVDYIIQDSILFINTNDYRALEEPGKGTTLQMGFQQSRESDAAEEVLKKAFSSLEK